MTRLFIDKLVLFPTIGRMKNVSFYKEKVLQGALLSKEELLHLATLPLEELCEAANDIRIHFCGWGFDLCTIVNGRSGRCSENCRYCAQSAHFKTPVEEYPLMQKPALLEDAERNEKKGVLRYSIVTSGRRLSPTDLSSLTESYRVLRETTSLHLCASHGLLSLEDCQALKAAGVTRYHNNLEASRRFFPEICTTHTYDDKIATIKAAQEAGLEVCSGGIMGLGETLEDRLDMFLDIREMGILSVPVNFLTPIEGTPYAQAEVLSHEEMLQILALVRFLNPKASVRLAAGRGAMPDFGRKAFLSGANSAITGDMLTTTGTGIADDCAMLKELGYQIALDTCSAS